MTWIRCVRVQNCIAKMKLDDMTCSVAATDASPPAAVLSVPRGEDVSTVTCDALLEGEQGGPLDRDAAAVMLVL
jgi:hypothetical protein